MTGGGVGVDVMVIFFFSPFKKIPTAAAEAQMIATIDAATMIFALRERRFAPMVIFPVSFLC